MTIRNLLTLSLKVSLLTSLGLVLFKPVSAIEQAHTADDFVDSIGVCTHLQYDTAKCPYNDYTRVKRWLADMGVRHIRDGSNRPYVQDWFHDLNTSLGIKTTEVFWPAPYWTIADGIALIKTHATPQAVDAVEGMNESDLSRNSYTDASGKATTTFPDVAKAYQTDLYQAVKSDTATVHLPVIAPSVGRSGNEAAFAPFTQFDYQVMHSYHNGAPLAFLDGFMGNSNKIVGTTLNKPLIATECGSPTGIDKPGLVSELAQGKYYPRMLAEYFNRGVVRSFLYELFEQGGETHGLVKMTWKDNRTTDTETPKPAYTNVKNLIAILKDPETSFVPGELDYTLKGGTPDVHHTLLQKHDGTFYLLLWQEVKSYDNTVNPGKDMTIAPVPVTVQCTTPITSGEWYDPSVGTQSTPLTVTGNAVTLSVPDSVVIVKLTPKGPLSIPERKSLCAAINAGGELAGAFVPDAGFNGGQTVSTKASITLTGVDRPAPQAVYQTQRSGECVYNIPRLQPGGAYLVRLHFAEIEKYAAGQRKFDVAINGKRILTDLDLFATAQAKNRARTMFPGP
ncbi:MAG TPA: malectin domain-containing carbohydrate-binding protein [Armatimonadota bacterium]|nr:malectin domain-containing carbohydrate-binding protein [Armatimonadota bacterium]